MLMLVGILVSCGNYESPDENPADTGSNEETTGSGNSNLKNDNINNSENKYGTPIEIENEEERKASDDARIEGFENFIYNNGGYQVVTAGKYYGNDFDNAVYYGSYYRIIDNYEAFSELTQWGKNIDESIFKNYFILVLHTHSSRISTSGAFTDFEISEIADKVKITETFRTQYYSSFPADVTKTIYLIIPNDLLTKEVDINGVITIVSSVLE